MFVFCTVEADKGLLLTVGHDRWRELPMTSELLSRDRDSNSALLPEMSHTFNHTLYQLLHREQPSNMIVTTATSPIKIHQITFQCPSNAFSMPFFQSGVK